MSSKPSSKKILLFGIIALLIFLFLIGWLPRFFNNKHIDAVAAKHPLPRVVAMQIKPNTKPITLTLPSSAQGWHITPIWSRVNGYLIRYLVDIGDVVKRGDLLAEIDTPETDEQVAQARADLANSIAERDIAKITTERWERLWDKNKEAVSKQEVDQYRANYIAAEATVVANEKNVAKYVAEQDFKYIYAPFDGIITQRNVDIGSLIYGNITGTPEELFQIADVSILRFFVDVPQNYFRQIKAGIKTKVAIKEFPGKTFNGIVERFAKALDPNARTLLTQVDVPNPRGLLYPGLFANITFIFTPDTVNFIIPTTAVIIRDGRPHVATLNDQNIVSLKLVEIGRDYGKEMEITNGLESNDRIITIPSDKILDGVQVNVIKEINSLE